MDTDLLLGELDEVCPVPDQASFVCNNSVFCTNHVTYEVINENGVNKFYLRVNADLADVPTYITPDNNEVDVLLTINPGQSNEFTFSGAITIVVLDPCESVNTVSFVDTNFSWESEVYITGDYTYAVPVNKL